MMSPTVFLGDISNGSTLLPSTLTRDVHHFVNALNLLSAQLALLASASAVLHSSDAAALHPSGAAALAVALAIVLLLHDNKFVDSEIRHLVNPLVIGPGTDLHSFLCFLCLQLQTCTGTFRALKQ